jgi:hypothetical protein
LLELSIESCAGSTTSPHSGCCFWQHLALLATLFFCQELFYVSPHSHASEASQAGQRTSSNAAFDPLCEGNGRDPQPRPLVDSRTPEEFHVFEARKERDGERDGLVQVGRDERTA